MLSSSETITFTGSRLKLVPQAIVLMAFILPLGFLGAGFVFAIGREGATPASIGGGALMMTALAWLIWLELVTLRRIAKPDVLMLAPTGLRMIVAGRTRTIPRTKLGTPELHKLSGRSAARSIIVPVAGGSRVVIAAEEYAVGVQDILKALNQTKAGLPIDAPEHSSQAPYLYIAIPASTLVLGIMLVGLTAILAN
ncbi:hypothetical protein CA234_14930 [Sphingomonas sp. ABOLE]|uniref:hypothetical protein n=1 Tax=Sphingomonas sp. ABOLE TaxID=1985878 RepID=UPI000F7E4062|nr:hypothetical protein [Sphingomonas sp. ABOLE]RSV39541.1 hypothetical protein CA234_14930 [Sphingomonas sp. ABOLE]